MTDLLFEQRNSNPVIAITGSIGKREVARLMGAGLAYDGLCYFSDNKRIQPTHKGGQSAFSLHVVDFLADAPPVSLDCDVCVITPVAHSGEACGNILAAMKAGGEVIIAENHNNSVELIKQAELKALLVTRVSLGRDDGCNGDNDVWVERMTQLSDCSCVIAHVAGERIAYKISLPGEQAVMNSLLALTAVKAAGGDMAMAAITFASQKARAGYGQEIKLGYDGNAFTLVDYTKGMNVLSLSAALAHMSLIKSGKYNHRIAVLSDFDETIAMDKNHLEDLHKHMIEAGITRVLTAGHMIAKLTRSAGILSEEFPSNRALKIRLKAMANMGDVVLVMGTVSSGLAGIIDELIPGLDSNDDRLKVAAE